MARFLVPVINILTNMAGHSCFYLTAVIVVSRQVFIVTGLYYYDIGSAVTDGLLVNVLQRKDIL